jgi:hypothetical protein
MNFSSNLIDEYKKLDGGKSDKIIAQEVPSMTIGNVSQVRTGLRHLTPEQAMFIAERCGLDIGEILVRLDMEKAKSPAVKAEFEKILKRLAGAFAAVALIVSLAMTPSPSEARASA